MIRFPSYLLRLFLLLLPWVAVLPVSCATEEIDGDWDGPVIELTLTIPDEMETRAGADGTKDGINKYNENLISWVDLFFYPGGETGSDATFHIRRASGKQGSEVMRIELTSEQVNTSIFPMMEANPPFCTVFALVNYPGTLVPYSTDPVSGELVPDLTGTSLDELHDLVITSDFVSPSNHRQERFMMSGQENLLLRGRAQVMAATGTIKLSRYACKMTVGVDVSDEVDIPAGTDALGNDYYEKWHPMLYGMEVYLVNGVNNVCLSGLQPDDPSYFSYRNNALRFAYMDQQDQIHLYFEKDGSYYNTYPAYMYPQHWEYGSTESPDVEPYLKLVVPWQREADPVHGISGTQRQYYYKVMIPDDRRKEYKRQFVRNNWYHINIRVGILGSETDEAMVPILSGSCYIYDWQDKNVVIKNAEIGNARYLSVEKSTYDLRNISSEVELLYTTSHPVMVLDFRATRPYYGDKTSGETLGGTVRKAGNNDIYPKNTYYLEYSTDQRILLNRRNGVDGDWYTDTGTKILFHHPLNNNYEDEYFDYSPYRISYTLRHADRPTDDSYDRTVTVYQYPAVFISALTNSDNTVKGTGKPKPNNYTSEHWGYVYVDGAQHFRSEYDEKANAYVEQGYTWNLSDGGTVRTIPEMMDLQWRVINYTGGSRDIFRMDITVLPENSDFVIGDPRSDNVNNLNPVMLDGTPVPFCTAPAIEGGERSLTWYYPTDSGDRTRNLMAPSYRIASKFGGIEYYNGTPKAEAEYRCASYQEDGFPAGRWRLPTRGEIRFIAMLSANKAFTFLFSTGSFYWSANGAIKVKDNDVEDAPNQPYALARCVYDTWYWGDEQLEDREQFTWGDARR